MVKLKLKIITPRKIIKEEEVDSISVPTSDGEITILPKHINLFTLLKEGIVKIKTGDKEDYLAIGGGYLQTDGYLVNLLVSRAYGQSEIDEKLTQKAIEEAKTLIKQSKDEKEKAEAISLLRRSMIDFKLLKRRKKVK
ncbi:MAG: ATP synthase F1 subunit epsilon [Microgenomates group bacterium]|nr:ATP synthase F1 subunit epsilon [Microgenomates group bacterium]